MRLQEMGIMTPDVRQKMDELQKSGAKQSDVWAVLQTRMLEFSGGMKTLSGTGDGLVSTLQDNWTGAVRTFGQAFSDSAKTGIQYMIDLIGKLTTDGTITRWADRVKEIMYSVAGLARALYQGGEQRSGAVSAIKDVVIGSFEIAAVKAINLLAEYAPRIGLAIGKGIKDAASFLLVNKNHEQYKQAAIEQGIIKEGSMQSRLHQGWWNIPDDKRGAFEARANELIADKYSKENKPALLHASDRLERGLTTMASFADSIQQLEGQMKEKMASSGSAAPSNAAELAAILTSIDTGTSAPGKKKGSLGADTVQTDALQRIGGTIGGALQMDSIKDLTREHVMIAKVMRDSLKKIESKDSKNGMVYA
jgi:hypothetical protein